MTNWIKKLFRITKRVELELVSWHEADVYLKRGWQLARPEEDFNAVPFKVWLEKREPDYD